MKPLYIANSILALSTGTVLADAHAVSASGNALAFDFNNQIDAVLVVSSAGENLVYFPDDFDDNDDRTGTVLWFTDLADGEGDTNAGTMPMIFANAINGTTASETFRYTLTPKQMRWSALPALQAPCPTSPRHG